MKKINIYIALFLVVTSFFACNILEQDSPDNIATDKVFQTADGILAARLGMYSLLGNENYYGGYYPLSLDAHSDNGATGGYVIESLDELGQKRLTPANLYIEKMWIAMYATSNAANQILENIEKIDSSEFESAAVRKNIKGEALFVRALVHFDVLKAFGEHWNKNSEYGIPLVKKVQKADGIVPRSSVSESYSNIIADLLEAEKLVDNDVKKGKIYITKDAVKALLARVYIFSADKVAALRLTDELIKSNKYSLFDAANFSKLYSERQTSESIFELKFDIQNRSAYNTLTYKRPDALRPDLTFMAAADLNTFFQKNKTDLRSSTIDFKNNDASISPDGRSQKYRGESLQDNPAYLLRYAEIILLSAEAKGFSKGLADLNTLRQKRGLAALTATTVNSEAKFQAFLLDEHRAEFNMEGHRFTDLARFEKVKEVLGKDVLPVFPIPLREIAATNGAIKQYPGY
jgi:starch-binding outer membrane protein, SusD/RagB family